MRGCHHDQAVIRAIPICVAFLVASCGDDRKPPTAPSQPPTATALRISVTTPTLAIGESQRLQASVQYSNGAVFPAKGPVIWRSSNDAAVATWSEGLVVAISPGEATITATADGLTASTPITAVHRGNDLRRVEGRVLDFASQAGVAGATLVFRTADEGIATYAGTTVTDGAGNYVIDLAERDYSVSIDDRSPAVLVVRVGSPAFRGDFYVNGGACIARYGLVIDDATFRPLMGATVRYGGGTATTDADGFYRIDHPCVGSVSGNTITVEASHPEYTWARRFSGRGLSSVVRLDFALRRP